MASVSSTQALNDRCVFCRQECRPRQQCLQCDFCNNWQHRTCETGISQAFYRRMVKGEATLENWSCYVCQLTEDLSKKIFIPLAEVTIDQSRIEEATQSNTTDRSRVTAPGHVSSTRLTSTVHVQQDLSPSSITTPVRTSTEDGFSHLYHEEFPLPLSNNPTPRSPAMPKLISQWSSSEELRLYLPESPCLNSSLRSPRDPPSPTPESQSTWSSYDSPMPSVSFLSKTPASSTHESQRSRPSTDPSLSPLFFSPHLTPFSDFVIPSTGHQSAWTATTDSPFPSPISFLMSPENLTSCRPTSNQSSPLPLFLDEDTHYTSSDLGSPLAQLEGRLVQELQL